MSLGALDFGLIVDASVVMVENFVRRLHGATTSTRRGRASRSCIREAAFEVGRPIVFGVAIIVAVYLPIFTLEGLEGRMFRPMAFTVCAAVLGSLVLALTYVPAVVGVPLRRATRRRRVARRRSTRTRVGSSPFARATSARSSGRSRIARTVVGGALGLLAVSLASVPFLGTEFMPKLDEGYLLIETRRVAERVARRRASPFGGRRAHAQDVPGSRSAS